MDNCIIVYLNPFSLSSNTIIIKNNEKISNFLSSDPNKLADELIDLAYSMEIYDIKIDTNANMAQGIIELVKEQENKNFVNNKIKIEVI